MQFLPSKDMSSSASSLNFLTESRPLPPLSEEDLEKLTAQFQECLASALPELSEAYAKIVESDKIIAEAKSNRIEAELKLVELNAKLIEADAKINEADAKINEADETLKQVAVEVQNIAAQHFHFIFTGKMGLTSPLAYSSAKSRKDVNGKYFSELDIRGVIEYLNDPEHSAVTKLDLRKFKKINDIELFAEFLKNSSIKAVAFLDSISEAAKVALAEAKEVRANTAIPLNVRYFSA